MSEAFVSCFSHYFRNNTVFKICDLQNAVVIVVLLQRWWWQLWLQQWHNCSLCLRMCNVLSYIYIDIYSFLGDSVIMSLLANAGDAGDKEGLNLWVRKIPWRRKWQPTPTFLPAEFHGQRSLVDYSPWGPRARHAWSDLLHTHIHTDTHVV